MENESVKQLRVAEFIARGGSKKLVTKFGRPSTPLPPFRKTDASI